MTLKLRYHWCPNVDCPGQQTITDRFGKVEKIIPAQMDYIEDYDYYSCYFCGTEVWMAVDKHKGKKVSTWEAKAVYKAEQIRQQKMRPKKGSSSSAGRKRKKILKPYMPWLPE